MSFRRYRALGYLALAGLFGWLFYERYWRWRDCIHEAASSCITPDGQSLTSGGQMWGLVAAALAAAALRLVLRDSYK